MNWKLFWKSGWQALKWQFIGWIGVTLITIFGVFSLVQSELHPWRFRAELTVAWIILWVIFYTINRKKEKEKDAENKP